MNIVILDANFLLIPSQFQVDVYQEIRMRLTGKLQIIIVPEVLNELIHKSDGITSTKFKRNVKMALELLQHQQQQFPDYFLEIPENFSRNIPVDDYLITVAEKKIQTTENEVFIATNDKDLRTKASIRGIRTIYLRQKKYLEISM